MNESYIRNAIEAALLAAGKPLQLPELTQIFDENVRPKAEEIRAALDALAAEYASRGIEIKETAAGFRIQVRREFASEVSRLWPERPARYSRALLETLALIAYRQPITRAEIEAVRGVAVNPNILKTVIERNWVRVVGHRDVPGRPELLGTTREFLDYFGLKNLDDLPPLAELKALGDINLQLELASGAIPVEARADSAGAAEAAGAGVGEATADGASAGATGVDGAGALPEAAAAGAGVGEATADGASAGATGVDGAGALPEAAAAVAGIGEATADDAIAGANGVGGAMAAGAVADDAVATESVRTPTAAAEGVSPGATGVGAADADADGGAGGGFGVEAAADGGTAEAISVDGVHATAGEGAALRQGAAVAANDGAAESAVGSAPDSAAGISDEAAVASNVESPAEMQARGSKAQAGTESVAEPSEAGSRSAADPGVSGENEVDDLLSAEESAAAYASGHDSTRGVGNREAATAEDADTNSGAGADDSSDAFADPSSDEDADDDELSADGSGSRELVAGPRDLGE